MTVLTFEDRQRVREAVNAHKRAEIDAAHGRHAITGLRKIKDCENCGAAIEHTRRYCDQACINEALGQKAAV